MDTKLMVGYFLFIIILLVGVFFFSQDVVEIEPFIPPDHFVYNTALENNQTVAEFCDGEINWNEHAADCIDLGIQYSCDYLDGAKYRAGDEYSLKDICHFAKAVHLNSSESYDECAKISDEISAKDCEIAVTPGGCFVSREHLGKISSLFPISYFSEENLEELSEFGRDIFELFEPCRLFQEITEEEVQQSAEQSDFDVDEIDLRVVSGVDVEEFSNLAISNGYNINHYCKDLDNFDNCMETALKYNFDFLDCDYFLRFDQKYSDYCNFLKGLSDRVNADFCYEISDEIAKHECASIAKRNCLVTITREQSMRSTQVEHDGSIYYQIDGESLSFKTQSEILEYIKDTNFAVNIDYDFCTLEG